MSKADQSLEDRVKEHITRCLMEGTYAQIGTEKDGGPRIYCTYFFLETRQEPIDCGMRGERITILKKGVLGSVPMDFYKCNQWK